MLSRHIIKVWRNKTNWKWGGYGKLVWAEVNLRFYGLATLRKILDWTNCCLTFCFQAEFRRTIVTSTFFRLVKFERLAESLESVRHLEMRANVQMGNEVTQVYLRCLDLRTSHLAHYFLHCSSFRSIPNMQPVCWLYKRFGYMQKTQRVIWKYVGGLQIVKNNLQEWLYSPTILKLENFSKESLMSETKMGPIFRDFI